MFLVTLLLTSCGWKVSRVLSNSVHIHKLPTLYTQAAAKRGCWERIPCCTDSALMGSYPGPHPSPQGSNFCSIRQFPSPAPPPPRDGMSSWYRPLECLTPLCLLRSTTRTSMEISILFCVILLIRQSHAVVALCILFGFVRKQVHSSIHPQTAAGHRAAQPLCS